MSGPVFMADPTLGHCAIFDEAAGGGDPEDVNSLCNRPLADPETWLGSVYFHSAFDYLEVAFDTTVTVSHGVIGSGTDALGSGAATQSVYDLDATVVDHDVLTHSLGYEPLVIVGFGDDVLAPGYPVQVPGTVNGSVRYVAPYVTSDKVFLREFRSRGSAGLSTISLDYRVVVFRQPPVPSGNNLIDFDPGTGTLTMGFERFDSSRSYLQVVPGGSPLGLATGRTMDAKNGAPRFVAPDGTSYDPVPSTVKMGIKSSLEGAITYGSSMNYTGTFAGGGAVLVQAP